MSPPAAPPSRELDDARLSDTAAAAMSRVAGRGVRLIGLRRLDGGSARNTLARATLEVGDATSRSVIVKITRAADHDAAAPDVLQASGFAREWTALQLLDRRTAGSSARPRLLAADAETGLLVLDDLGDEGGTLVGPLTGRDESAAATALLELVDALGALHAMTAGCADEYARLARDSFPHASLDRPSSLPAFERIGRTLVERPGGTLDATELVAVARLWDNPGPWAVLTHGDPCPDNALVGRDARVALLDYEFARPGHALLDASFWHLGFPSCSCAGAVPSALVARADERYHRALSPAIALCVDESSWSDELARTCVLQLPLGSTLIDEVCSTTDEPG